MAPIDLREFGRLEEKVEAQGREIGEVKDGMRDMTTKLDELLALANKGKGGFWAGMTFVSMAGTAAGWVLHNVFGR